MPMTRDKPQFTAEQLREAGIKSFQNASELVEEATLLFDHGRFSRSIYLCCIAGEELGKCFISLSAVMNRRVGKFDEKRYKQRFRTHREKTGILHFFEDVFVSSSDLPIEASDAGANTLIETMKLASLYTDFYGVDARTPSELITKQLTSEVLRLAKNRAKHFSENVRPMFDHVLQIDLTEFIRLRDKSLGEIGANDLESEVDS